VNRALHFEKALSKEQQIQILEKLVDVLKHTTTYSEKLELLPDVSAFLKTSPLLEQFLKKIDVEAQYVIKALLAIGQGPVVFQELETIKKIEEFLLTLVEQLIEIEEFYDDKGGIVGYHLLILKLLNNSKINSEPKEVLYKMPPEIDISKRGRELNEAVRWGIESMQFMGEIYPVGGAGDRLNLKDKDTGEPLPAAQLLFCGRSMLELLLRDLHGREFLYYKLFDKQIFTPIAVMTSEEKDNYNRILELCKDHEWFGRPFANFRFFLQPMVPVVTVDGDWAISQPLQLILKPSGHGVIWKAALDGGVFDWFEERQIKKVLVRQINNPIAGIDTGLFALVGIGCKNEKQFGFASCNRLVGSSEGMDVLRIKKNENGLEYCITNIEYTEFKKRNIEDSPEKVGSPFSRFPANTNILFGDLAAIKSALNICSVPGMLINLKNRFSCYTKEGYLEKYGGRLESTMQNIADYIVDKTTKELFGQELQNLKTFLTYNDRIKTISVVKQLYVPGKPLTDTPENCFYDLLKNYHELLSNYCKMQLPPQQDENNYITEGPDCIVLFHPALGMLYSIIAQKIKGGKLTKGSEWVMEISEVEIVNLNLNGSLLIESDCIMGKKDIDGVVIFDSNALGKCTLINVKIRNQGRVRTSGMDAWRCETERKETLRITLHGNAEFFAENVELVGDVHFEVPEGHRLVVYQQGNEIAWHFEEISKASWSWEYFFEEDGSILLEKKLNL
jgi:hypothetical protein